jgi:hypothetical protein
MHTSLQRVPGAMVRAVVQPTMLLYLPSVRHQKRKDSKEGGEGERIGRSPMKNA